MNDERSIHAQELLTAVARVAAEVGLNSDFDESKQLLVIPVDLAGDRKQVVYVRKTEDSNLDRDDIATFFSPCGVLSQSELENASFLVELLEDSARINFGSKAIIHDDAGRKLLILMCHQIVETMEKEEISAIVHCLATSADDFERRRGRDDY